LHLICHGLDDPDGQILDLDSDERLREVQLSGIAGIVRAVAEKRPFVFINACQVGRSSPSLVAPAGSPLVSRSSVLVVSSPQSGA